MFNFMVTNEGGLTTAGYAIAIIAGIILFLAAICFAGKHSEKHKLTTRQLVFCAVAVALAFVTSYLKIFTLPWGGSVTLCSMLFIVLAANWYGVGTGITVGLALESCSLSRNHMYFPSSRFAVIISLHSLPLELPDSSQSKAMVCLKDTLWQLLPEVHFMHLADICTG